MSEQLILQSERGKIVRDKDGVICIFSSQVPLLIFDVAGALAAERAAREAAERERDEARSALAAKDSAESEAR